MNADKYIRAKDEHRYWNGKKDFLLSGICCVLGLGDLSMFPLFVYTGAVGGAFYLPYVYSMMCVGIPTLVIEISLGQFSSSSSLTCWKFCPLMSGCGLNMLIMLCLLAVYFNSLTGWGIYLFFISLTSEIPWTQCGNWSTHTCIDNVRIASKTSCQKEGIILSNGVCGHGNDSDKLWMWSEKVARKNNIILSYPTMEYFNRVKLANRDKKFNVDYFSIDVLLCLLLATFIMWMFVSRGVRISVKVAFLIMVLPYSILVAFVIRGMALEGSKEGIDYFIYRDINDVVSLKIWNVAARHICFSMSVAYGTFIALASYNKFHYDILRDIIILPTVDCIGCLLSGIAVFSHLGFLASNMQLDIGSLTSEEILEVLPYVITKLAAPNMWSGFFFLMIVIISLNSQRIILEAVVISIMDWKPALREKKFLTSTVLCLTIFIAGLPMATTEAFDIMRLISISSGGLNILIFAFIENFAIGWLYGADRFIRDIEIMIQSRFCTCFMFGRFCRLWWTLCWKYLSPISIMIFIILWGFDERDAKTPEWVVSISWVITAIFICGIITGAVHQMVKVPGTLKEKWDISVTPTREWGPALVEHRQLVEYYIPNFVVNLHDDLVESLNMVTMPGEPVAVSVASEDVHTFLDDVQTENSDVKGT